MSAKLAKEDVVPIWGGGEPREKKVQLDRLRGVFPSQGDSPTTRRGETMRERSLGGKEGVKEERKTIRI